MHAHLLCRNVYFARSHTMATAYCVVIDARTGVLHQLYFFRFLFFVRISFFFLAVVDECGVGFGSIKITREIPKQNNQNKKRLSKPHVLT